MTGWVKIYRTLSENRFWIEKPFSRGQAWIDLILLANHKPGYVRKRGIRVDVQRGQVGHSIKGLADRWGWSQGKVKRFLKELKNEEQIEEQNNKVTTLITLLNYDKHQGNGEQNGSQTENRRRTDGEQTETNKNDKKEKNEKNEKKYNGKFRPPTVDEVREYCQQRNNGIDAQYWVDSYTAKGWVVGTNKTPMKDWKAAIRTWEKSNIKKKSDTCIPSGAENAI